MFEFVISLYKMALLNVQTPLSENENSQRKILILYTTLNQQH